MALTDKLTAIANAIREKTGRSESLTIDQMPSEIRSIEGGGGGEGGVIATGSFTTSTFGAKTLDLPTFSGEAVLVVCADDATIQNVISTTSMNHEYNVEYVQFTGYHVRETVGVTVELHATAIQRSNNKTTFAPKAITNKRFGYIADLYPGTYHWTLLSYSRE